MNNKVPNYIEKVFTHSNGQSFKVLTINQPNKDSFYIEYPSNTDLISSRLIKNKIKTGLIQNFIYRLEISGVGYKAQKDGQKLLLYLGKSVPLEINIPQGIDVDIKKNGVELVLSGKWIDDVSLLASKIRELKPAHKDKYKQKGILLFKP